MQRPISMLVAATGYGKTFAAQQFWAAFSGRKAWWSASESRRADGLEAAAAWVWRGETDAMDDRDPPDAAAQDDLRLLLVDLADAPASAPLWSVITDLAEQMPAQARLMLLSRTLPVHACVRWSTQGRLQLLDHTTLALDAEEWQCAGLAAVGHCADGAGWWGPAAWLHAGQGAWTTLADWVADVWFPTLPLPQRTLLGQLSLLPDNTVEVFGALHGYDLAHVESVLRDLTAVCGALWHNDGRAGIGSHFRKAVAEAWRKTDVPGSTTALMSTLDSELSRYRLNAAARLADEAGPGPGRRLVLQRAGLHMLYTGERTMLGRWLAAPLDLEDQERCVLRCAWLVEVEKSAHVADTELRQHLPQLTGSTRAQALALQATIALDYDECDSAESLASAALDGFDNDRHPLSVRARITRGSARAVLGRLDEAAEDLRLAHLCAERDGLVWLLLDSLQRRAMLAADQGDRREAQAWLRQALDLAQQKDLQNNSTMDSCRRLQAWLHLEQLDAAAARRAREADTPFWAFPRHVHLALEALLEDRLAEARNAADWLMRTLASSFQPRKWQNQAAWIDIWLAAHDNDVQRLLYWERQLAILEEPADVHADRRRVLLAGVRCLLGVADDRDALRALFARLQSQGARAMALQLQLILSLQNGQGSDADFHACLAEGARAQAHLDYLWLGPRVTPLLQQSLSAPLSGCDAELHAFVRRLLQRLLSPVPAGNLPPEQAAPGLTTKETQILRLIGQHYSNEQIAAGLFISQATVKTHINRIYSKLGLKNRGEAIQRARQLFI